MSTKQLLEQAETARREAKRERFANGETPLYHALLDVARVVDRAAQAAARHDNRAAWGRSLTAYQRGA